MAAVGCSQGDGQLGEPAEEVQFDEVGAALTQTGTVSLKLPADVELHQVSVAAQDTLTLNDRVRIEGTATAATAPGGTDVCLDVRQEPDVRCTFPSVLGASVVPQNIVQEMNQQSPA